MSNDRPIDRATAEGFSSNVPSQPVAPKAMKPTWDSHPLVEGMDQWNFIRRNEIAQIAIPLVIAQIREGDGALATGDSWREDPEQEQAARDQAIVSRAVMLARLVQAEVDKARPRA